MLKLIALIVGVQAPQSLPKYAHVCHKDWSSKSLEAKIELSVCCSEVEDRRVCLNSELEDIWQNFQ